jgi:Uma2 family endonuclease
MVSIVKSSRPAPSEAEPAWDIARLFPYQGSWTERDYLELDTNHLVEFTDGFVEVLPMPKMGHQKIAFWLAESIKNFVRPRKMGTVLTAPFRVRVRKSKYREPDVMFMFAEHASRMGEDFWEGADLVVEVVSDDPESRERDHRTKREDYAEAGVPEYWIVDPQDRKVIVLNLVDRQYAVHGEFGPGMRASSEVLPGFDVEVTEVLAAATEP